MADVLTQVLLIEDDLTDALLLRDALALAAPGRFRLTPAECLADGEQLLRERSFDVVLLDLGLPDSRGIDTFTRLQASAAGVPVVVLTGLADEDLATRAVQSGAQDYLNKTHIEGHGLARAIRYAIERKRVAVSLAQSNDMLQRAEQIGQMGSWEWDLAANRVIWSHGLYTIFGASRQGLDTASDAILDFLHPDERERVRDIVYQAVAEGGFFEFESRFLRTDGQRRVLYARGEVLVDDRGQAARVLGIAMDITERSRREQELEAIVAVSTALREAGTQAELLSILLEQMMDMLEANAAAVGLQDAESGELVVVQGAGELEGHTGMRMPPGAGIGGHVLDTRQPYSTADIRTDPFFYNQPGIEESAAAACVPLVTRHQLLGVLWVGRPEPFLDEEVHVLSAIANIAANALQRISLYEQTEVRLNRLAALRQIDGAIMHSLDLQLTLGILLGQAIDQLGMDAADVLLLDRGTNLLEYAAGRGFRSNTIQKLRLRMGEGYAGQAVLERRLVAVYDLPETLEKFRRADLAANEGFVTFFCVPLIAKGQVVGVLEVYNRSPHKPDADWLDFLETLAGQAAIAVADARLFSDLQHTNTELQLAYDSTLEGWARALELRDQETEGHSQRVTALALELARSLGMRNAELVHLRRGALLHDLGKMGIPDSILLKPVPLTDEEWVVMCKHPTYAYELLSPIAYLQPALEIPYCHHEKWDGSGYPRRLAGEQIPLAARIFAVVDVWDALLSDRPYRKAWSRERAQDTITAQAGSHFDPRVVEHFLAILETGEAAKEYS